MLPCAVRAWYRPRFNASVVNQSSKEEKERGWFSISERAVVIWLLPIICLSFCLMNWKLKKKKTMPWGNSLKVFEKEKRILIKTKMTFEDGIVVWKKFFWLSNQVNLFMPLFILNEEVGDQWSGGEGAISVWGTPSSGSPGLPRRDMAGGEEGGGCCWSLFSGAQHSAGESWTCSGEGTVLSPLCPNDYSWAFFSWIL